MADAKQQPFSPLGERAPLALGPLKVPGAIPPPPAADSLVSLGPDVGPLLFDLYRVAEGSFDEYFDSTGRPRPAASKFVAAIQSLGLEELSRRKSLAERQIYENSVTYSAQSELEQINRPWQLDLLPLLISGSEWSQLSAGLCQRSRLLNAILLDIYGPQTLVKRGLLPPELLYANPRFSRSYCGVEVPQDLHLHLSATDLTRASDGRWWVLSDRTEAPSGAAYALENRLVSSGLFPDLFRSMNVDRLAPFFLELRQTCQRMAHHHVDNPRVALLSAGSKSSNYFEDAYLARYLGYALVEGEDLTVRGDRIVLKTLGQLLPIDVLIRRFDALDCDPLELRGSSFRGVTGLVQSLRQKGAAVVNSCGSGILESPAFLPFLPGIARALFGEELLLPSVATWWCGDERELEYALTNLDKLIVRPAFGGDQNDVIAPETLSKRTRAELVVRISDQPKNFVVQERVARSRTPVWTKDGLHAWPMTLRTFSVAQAADTYLAMPGGLARVASDSFSLSRALSAGDATKDTWVLSDGVVPKTTLLRPPGLPVDLRRSGEELPSRVADNLFWLGRHAERAESCARFLRTTVGRLLAETGGHEVAEVRLLVRTLAELGEIDERFGVESFQATLPALENALPQLVYGSNEPSNLRQTLSNMNRMASRVRERLSGDSFRLINRISREFHPRRANGRADLAETLQSLNRLIVDLSAFSGLVMESMTRTLGWRFLDIGRRIDRALHVSALLHNLSTNPKGNQPAVLEAVLEAGDSLITYRSRYLNVLQIAPVLDLLLTDDTNPRSVLFQLLAMKEHVATLPRTQKHVLTAPDERLIERAITAVRSLSEYDLRRQERDVRRGAEPADLTLGSGTPVTDQSPDNFEPARPSKVRRVLEFLQAQLPKFSQEICNSHLNHTVRSSQLTETRSRKTRRTDSAGGLGDVIPPPIAPDSSEGG